MDNLWQEAKRLTLLFLSGSDLIVEDPFPSAYLMKDLIIRYTIKLTNTKRIKIILLNITIEPEPSVCRLSS